MDYKKAGLILVVTIIAIIAAKYATEKIDKAVLKNKESNATTAE